ncbi:hypothetical protein IAD21_01581 [Abditibacteriota bacterium]|nr:hypothetical protein IAD21_01581 [Abditibacteriota bacterium]
MPQPAEFAVASPSLHARKLTLDDAEILQKLYEQCHDYAVLEQGFPYAPTSALDEFGALPPGKTLADKFLFGLFDEQGTIIGLIESIRYYPDDITWWLGLMLLAPQHRRKGLGTEFYKAFENWAANEGAHHIQLAALEENESGQRFWQSLGFREIRRTEPKPYGNKHHKLIVMQRTIA